MTTCTATLDYHNCEHKKVNEQKIKTEKGKLTIFRLFHYYSASIVWKGTEPMKSGIWVQKQWHKGTSDWMTSFHSPKSRFTCVNLQIIYDWLKFKLTSCHTLSTKLISEWDYYWIQSIRYMLLALLPSRTICALDFETFGINRDIPPSAYNMYIETKRINWMQSLKLIDLSISTLKWSALTEIHTLEISNIFLY